MAEEAVEDAPSTTPEAAPSVEPIPDTAIIEQTPPATEEPADDKPGKKSKKSSRTKEKESKSKFKAKEKEKEKVKEAEKEKDRGKEKENERVKSNGRKKKGKSKVDSVVIPADEPTSNPEASGPPDDAIAETQAEPLADPTTETIADPPTEPPTEQIVDSEVPQSEGVIADAHDDPLEEKSTEPDQVPEPEKEATEATEATDTQTKDLRAEEATTAHGIEDNLNNDPTAPDLQGTQSGEMANDDAGTDNDSKVTQPSLGMDTNPAEPPLTAQDAVTANAPTTLSDTDPPSVPADVEVVEVIEAVVTETTQEAFPAEIPDDSTQPGNEKLEIIKPVLKDEELMTEEQPDKVPESETAAPIPTNGTPAANTTDEAPQPEVVLETPSEVTQAEESKFDDQPVGTPPAETAGTTSQDLPPEGLTDAAVETVQAEEEKVEAIEPSLGLGDANADETSINVAQDEATIVETETVDKAIEDGFEPNSSAAEPVLEIVPDAKDEKDEKAMEDKIQETPAPDDSPIQSVPAADSEKAVETSPAEEPPIVEQIASTEDPSSAPDVETTHNQELAPQANVESAASEPTLVEESTAEPAAEVAPSAEASADVPPSPSSEKHRKKKVTGWERQRRYSKTSTAGSDLSGSTTKKSPSSDKPPSESTTTNHKRHSSKRTFELNIAGVSGEYEKSDRPKISRSSTSRRSYRKDRAPEPAARPRIFERVKTEADGRLQHRVNDTAPERPSRRRGEESFRREHRSDKHRDGERHREREKDREKEKEKEREKREKAREEARAHDEEKEKKRRQEDEERRERRRRRREEEDQKSKDGEGQDRRHRHRGGHDRERRRRGSSPPPAMKIGKSLGSGLRRLLAI